MKRIVLALMFSFVFTASPFFESSVYVPGTRVNIRKEPDLNAALAFVAEKNRAFRYIETINKNKVSWYKIEYYDPEEYDIYYKPRTNWSINPRNFSKVVDLYQSPSLTSDTIEIMPNIRNFKYDNKPASQKEWVRVRVFKNKVAFVASSVSIRINRPYFLAEIALEAIDRNRWDYRTRQSILDGELFRNMTPSMVKAVKGEPDSVYEDKTGRDLYYTWFYGSQALNFRNHRLTSW